MREPDLVVLARDLPELGPARGDVGAVVHVYDGGTAVKVESVAGSGAALAVETLAPADVRPLGDGEILHARALAA